MVIRMWQAVLLAFLAGLLGADAYPHFTKGIAAERFPTVFGSSPRDQRARRLVGPGACRAVPVGRAPGAASLLGAAGPGRRRATDGPVPCHRPYDRRP